jgi:hypothetical protein
MNFEDFDQKEARKYSAGKPVELKHQPGKVYVIAEYDPMMVPPVWLKDDPMPHYPHELRLMNSLFCLLSPKHSQAA